MVPKVRKPDICTISTAVLESSVEGEAWSRVPAVAMGRVCQREGRQEDAIITTWFPTACVSTVRPVYSTLRTAIEYYSINPHINAKEQNPLLSASHNCALEFEGGEVVDNTVHMRDTSLAQQVDRVEQGSGRERKVTSGHTPSVCQLSGSVPDVDPILAVTSNWLHERRTCLG
ncbi:hypothetical protein E2C01_005498 [Portunus trituberculatus]|uniref:Uncharacterized protein n=1 Tax=Portunus trituberculatus TaxID=210409 RepID=A0A5B7CTN2_PORTR|nr:hypothetical protein [Portunus trituberculatus]